MIDPVSQVKYIYSQVFISKCLRNMCVQSLFKHIRTYSKIIIIYKIQIFQSIINHCSCSSLEQIQIQKRAAKVKGKQIKKKEKLFLLQTLNRDEKIIR